VGTRETLQAYLVRRLLENGANTSFVNRIADETVPLAELVEDPVRTVLAMAAKEGAVGLPHPAIPLPRALYGAGRANSRGLDLADELTLAALTQLLAHSAGQPWLAEPLLAGDMRPVLNPADRSDGAGSVRDATPAEVQAALGAAVQAAPAWAATAPAERAALLDAGAASLEADTEALVTLLVRQAGKTCGNTVAEVSEAVDVLRYDAAQVRNDFDNARYRPLGPVVCISPWNFPLAIFTGQVAAALAAGNPVLAKPAEQTPLAAAAAVRAPWAAGVPRGALQLQPGPGDTVGAALVADAGVQGVLFTGSTEVARLLQRTLAGRLRADGQPVPLVAETGGPNSMIVNPWALAEQVVADVEGPVFDSAGQRCSALRVLRVLCVQRDGTGRLIEMLEGAVRELRVGDTRLLAVGVGPVIDAEAPGYRRAPHRWAARQGPPHHPARGGGRRRGGPRHLRAPHRDRDRAHRRVAARGFRAGAACAALRPRRAGRPAGGDQRHRLRPDDGRAHPHRRNPDPGGAHRARWQPVCQPQYRGRGGGRAALRRRRPVAHRPQGRRATVAVAPVGQPAGGCGPACRAGGRCRNAAALRGWAATADELQAQAARSALLHRAQTQGRADPALARGRFGEQAPTGAWRGLAGPTGEANLYAVLPREVVLCPVAPGSGTGAEVDADASQLLQLAAVPAVGSRAVWPADSRPLWDRLPHAERERVALAQDWRGNAVGFDAVLHQGPAEHRQACCGSWPPGRGRSSA